MKIKDALIRAARTAAQALAAALIGLSGPEVVTDIPAKVATILLALWVAFLAGVVAFLQNIAEDNTTLNLPK